MFPIRQGGATQRPGTQFIHATQNGGAAIRFIPFIFNETSTGQSYVLEFGNLYIAFYQNGGVVLNGGVPYTIVSPYAQADLAALQYAQSADVVTITHPSYPPYELRRVAATNWTIATITFGPSIAKPTNIEWTGTGGAAITNTYAITAINSIGEESLAGFLDVASSYLLAASGANPVKITWDAVTNAVSYRVYVASARAGPLGIILQGGGLGFIGQVVDNVFVDNGITADYQNSPPINNTLFDSANNYPSTVGFSQQRRCFANTNNNPVGFWLSQPGSFSNFSIHPVSQDSDAILSSLSSDQVNAIQHVLELKFMLMLTAGSEIYVQGNGSGVLTPSAINASTQSQYGCAALIPIKLGDVLLFNQALGSFIRDFSFDFSIDGYRGNDITVFSSHLFESYRIADWTFQKIPDSLVWAVRNDGILLCCTYVREQQVLAWSQHDFTNGLVENVCAIPENGNYVLYLSIKRVINGSAVRYVERMSSRLWTDQLNATYLDCFASYDGTNTGSTTMTLTASGGFRTSTDNTAYQQHLTLTASAGFFTSNMVGNQIFLNDATWVATQGFKGNQIRCTIISFTSTTIVTVTPDRFVPTDLQATAILTWARAVKTLSGLDYLEGQEVSIWADRGVVGSPLNDEIDPVYTVTSGSITLDKCYVVIYVGLPMVADIQTLDLETSGGETMLSRRKKANQLALYMYKTKSFFAGSENPDTNLDNTDDNPLFQLFQQMVGQDRTSYDAPWAVQSDQDWVLLDAEWNKNGRLFLRNVDPSPWTVLSIAPMGEAPVNSPYIKP